MKKPSKKTREQAAMICAIAASTPGFGCSYLPVTVALDQRPGDALDLAMAAWEQVSSGPAFEASSSLAEIDAEAEAMLRCGWSPAELPRARVVSR